MENMSSVERELLDSGTCIMKTFGSSMQPLFRDGKDIVIISKKEASLKKYDVALYRVGEKYVLHRVVGKRGGDYLMRGDNTYAKELVTEGEVLGVLVEYIRNGKRRSVKSFFYKVYSVVWNFIYPMRLIFKKGIAFLSRTWRKIFKKGVSKQCKSCFYFWCC